MSVPVRPPIASPFVPRPGGLPPPPPGAIPPRPGLPAGALPPPMPAPPPGMGMGAMPPMPMGMPGMPPPMAQPQPPTPNPQPPQPPATDPVQLLAALKELVGTPIKERQPVYRPGFTPPAKPDPMKAIEAGRRLYDQALAWRV